MTKGQQEHRIWGHDKRENSEISEEDLEPFFLNYLLTSKGNDKIKVLKIPTTYDHSQAVIMCPSLCRDGCTGLSELWGELAFDSEDVLNEEIVKGLGKECTGRKLAF